VPSSRPQRVCPPRVSPRLRACARTCGEANHASPTGSKTGHPFLANGPRRITRVGEPSRRSRLTLPESRFLGAVSGAAQPPKRICVRSGVSRSLPLSLSEHLVVISAVSNAELECPSEFRDSQAVARICVHVFHRTDHPPDPFGSREARGRRRSIFPREGRQLLDSRGAFHRLESMCTGIAPSAFIDRSSDHASALLIGYPFP
jgi:hypothetical protein